MLLCPNQFGRETFSYILEAQIITFIFKMTLQKRNAEIWSIYVDYEVASWLLIIDLNYCLYVHTLLLQQNECLV